MEKARKEVKAAQERCNKILSKVLGVPRNKFVAVANAQQQKPLPPRRMLVEPVQPGRQKHIDEKRGRWAADASSAGQEVPELAALISRAGREMANHGANVWSVNGSQNHYFMHGFGETMRTNALKTGVLEDVSSKLGLIYGALFGFRALHEARRYTRFGQVKDDVERTLRYWHCDGTCLRFMRYAVQKRHKPGKFNAKKGGISAATGAAGHEREGCKALRGMLAAFAWRYARLPKPSERCADVGLVWLPRQARAKAEVPDEDAPALAPEGSPPPKRPPTCRPVPKLPELATAKASVDLKRPAAAALACKAKRARPA